MKRSRSDARRLGPAAAAMRRMDVFRDGREAKEQISVAKILSDAAEMQRFHAPAQTSSARVTIHTPEELAMYRQKRRSELEVKIKKGFKALGNWINYARWEAQQGDYSRMRAVLERAVAVHGENPKLWRDYAELEELGGFVEHARQVWSRGVTALPASVDLWLKYALFEQVVAGSSGNLEGELQRTRDVFSRWLSGPTVPSCAYEACALFEAQRGRAEACRDVLRQYVETANTPEAWLLYSRTEQFVFGDSRRAIRVLQTTLEALPEALVWGPIDCRIPLALADTLAASGQVAEARATYNTLLRRLQDTCAPSAQGDSNSSTSPTSRTKKSIHNNSGSAGSSGSNSSKHSLTEVVLTAYGRFERLHGDSQHYENLARVQARTVYEAQVAANPHDYDAILSLYLLLRDEERRLAEAVGSSSSPLPSSSSPTSSTSDLQDVRSRAMELLKASISGEATGDGGSGSGGASSNSIEPYRVQQRAVLTVEYARRAEAAEQVGDARAAFAEAIRSFPFSVADCPRLWREAAALEARQGDYAQARKLLRAAAHVTKDGDIYDAALGLEKECLAAAQSSPSPASRSANAHAEYVEKVRQIYQDAIKAFPFDEKRWFGFASFEEKEGQAPRAKALLTACARTMTAEASKTKSFTHRYELLVRVDTCWARMVALRVKLLKRAVKSAAVAAEVDTALQDLQETCAALMKAVWADFRFEALAWRTTAVSASSTIPSVLAEVLATATARWSEAVDAAKVYLVRNYRGALGVSDEAAKQQGLACMRGIFRDMVEEERALLRRTLGLDDTTGFDMTQRVNQWVDLLLTPLMREWSKFEALDGGSIESMQDAVGQPVKRRTRLFKGRK